MASEPSAAALDALEAKGWHSDSSVQALRMKLVAEITCEGQNDSPEPAVAMAAARCGIDADYPIECIWVRDLQNELLASKSVGAGCEPTLSFPVAVGVKMMWTFTYSPKHGVCRSDTYAKFTDPRNPNDFEWRAMDNATGPYYHKPN